MQKFATPALVILVSTFSLAHAQYPGPQGPSPDQGYGYDDGGYGYRGYDRGRPAAARPTDFETEPAPGISVRSDLRDGVQTVSSAPAGTTELRLTQGRADVIVRHPEDGSQIMVDLPGGQVSLIKDGFYTFNAATDTVRVLNGEAIAYTGIADTSKGTKVKETQQLAFNSGVKPRAVDASRAELSADLLPGNQHGDGYGRHEGPYGDGFYGGGGYPYYGGGLGFYGGYPFYGGFGYPYGYGFGYPFGIGLGFGYYGGFGGFRGGYGGFRGGVGGFRR